MDDINSIINEIKKSALDDLFSLDYDAAIGELRKGEMLDRDNPEILFNLGIAYCRKGLFNTAHDYYLKVLNLETSFINKSFVKKNLSYALIQIKKYNEALKYLNEVIEDYKTDIHALNMKGFCLEKKGDLKGALKTYREIFTYEKSNINSLNSTSYLMALLDIELESALKIARFVYNSNSNNPAYNDTLGFVYMKLGNFAEAEKFFNSAKSMLPFDSEINQHIEELNKLKK